LGDEEARMREEDTRKGAREGNRHVYYVVE
jgi:hypothetical protein